MSSGGHASDERLAAQSPEIHEIDENQADDDGQQRPSVGGERPRMWHSTNFENSDVRVSIFTVPEFIKETNRKAYVPRIVSLGPLHYNSEELSLMNHHKERALFRMMTKMNIERDDMDFPTATLSVEDNSVEYKMKAMYEKNISYDGKTLSWMLCLDGLCILEVLRTLDGRYCEPGHRNDLMIFENKLLASNILKDIVMLENQIPWIVLLELLRLEKVGENTLQEFGEDAVKWELMNLLQNGTSRLFKISWQDKNSLKDKMIKREVDHILHFLHEAITYQSSNAESYQVEHPVSIKSCIGYCLLMLQRKHKALDADCESIPTAVELNNAGIKFRPCNGGISGITFDQQRAIIYLPVVYITYGTEVLFRNLIAWEMWKPSESNFVSSYVNFMDDLIDSQEDVALLRSMGILIKLIGSDKEVADLFNGLCRDVGIENMADLFVPLKKSVNKHYRDKMRVQFAELVRDHFSSYWKALATVGAIAILGLTIVQTIFTIKSAT